MEKALLIMEKKHYWSRKSRVISRYHSHKKEYYGKSGLIVLAYTRSETEALQMEKELIREFRNDEDYKEKIVNRSTRPGKKSRYEHDYYCVYLAFGMNGKSM